jgi:hypothetical protein
MQDPFPRTLAAQEASADWIGTFAGEQLTVQLRSAQLAGALSSVGEQWLQHCLPGLEACIEELCPAEMRHTKDGLTTQYGFPQSNLYPVVVSVMHVSAELPAPEFAALSGTIRRWPLRSRLPSRSVGAGEWWQVISSARTRSWPAVRRALTTMLSDKCAATIGAQFRDHADATRQLVVVVLAAGNAEMSSGVLTLVSLTAIAVSADALRINLGPRLEA